VRDLPLLKTPEGTILVSRRSGIRGMSVKACAPQESEERSAFSASGLFGSAGAAPDAALAIDVKTLHAKIGELTFLRFSLQTCDCMQSLKWRARSG
jgi:hypothetical protein